MGTRLRIGAALLVMLAVACSGHEVSGGPGEGTGVLDDTFADAKENPEPGGEEGPIPGELMDGSALPRPCTGPGDCPTGVCVEAPDGATYCAESCLDEPCPADWKCTQVLIAGDPNFLCLPRATYLCRPCRVHEDCAPKGLLSKDYCFARRGTWFCGQDCSSGVLCPGGFTCEEVEVAGVGRALQCVPEGGVCTCIEEFVAGGFEATCEVGNEWGTCRGTRRCGPEGLTPCDARTPAPETCDGSDEDCDGLTDPEGAEGCLTYWPDADGDLYGPEASGSRCLCAPEGLWSALKAGDCDDLDPDRNPGVLEKCGDGWDNDCDGEGDEEGALGCANWYADRDGDGHGDKGDFRCLCGAEGPFTASVADDCDDQDGGAHPGATEACNGQDDDCDGQTDEEGAQGCQVLFWDGDQDGVGVPGDSRCLCAPLDRYTTAVSGDCNDAAPHVHPGALEACNGLDDDCDGLTDGEGADGCQDRYYDGDGDTYGNEPDKRCLCGPEGKYTVTRGGDCDDGDPGVNPGAAEVCGNGQDDNCNGSQNDEGAMGCLVFYLDEDGDGSGVSGDSRCLCVAEGMHRTGAGGDCDDGDPGVNPGAKEDCQTARDDNCNGAVNERDATGCAWFRADRDGDGFGTDKQQCWCAPSGVFSAGKGGDCDDSREAVHPGAVEVCNGLDDDCSAESDEGEDLAGCKTFYLDADGDGWGVAASKCLCGPTGQYRATKSGDCRDEQAAAFPGAPEICDGVDNDCDGHTDDGHDAFPDAWPGLFGPDPMNPWRYPAMSFATTSEVLTPSGDVDYFSVEATEANLTQCLPLRCKVTLSGIPEGQDFVLCACWSDIMECDLSGGQWTCSDSPGQASETVTVVLPEFEPLPGSCKTASGLDVQNHAYCDIRVARVSGPASCAPYHLNWIAWE